MEYNQELGLALYSLLGSKVEGQVNISHIQDDYLRKEVMVSLSRLGGEKEGDTYTFPKTVPIHRLLRIIHDSQTLPDKEFFDSFSTPKLVVDMMWDQVHRKLLADKTTRFLEPSAGTGAILQPMVKHKFGSVVAFENHPLRYTYLEHNFYNMAGVELYPEDFLRKGWRLEPFDLVVANPPMMAKGDNFWYVDHIAMMMECLKKGGQLVCLVPDTLFESPNKKVAALRRLLKPVSTFTSINPEMLRGIPTKQQFSVMSTFKLSGRIHSDSANTNRHYKEILHDIRLNARRKAAERIAADQEQEEAENPV